MKKMLVAFFFVGMVGFSSLTAREAQAFTFDLGATLGSSYTARLGKGNGPGPFNNFGANLEIMPSLQFLFVSADLGIHYDFLQSAMTLRPGARLYLGWFYLRAALPLAFSMGGGAGEPFDLGILVGAGLKINLGKWAFVAEANVSPMFLHVNQNGATMPAELRFGLSYRF